VAQLDLLEQVGIRARTIVAQLDLLEQVGIRARTIVAQLDLLEQVGIRARITVGQPDLVDTGLIRMVRQGVAPHSNAVVVSEHLAVPVLPLVDLKVAEEIDLPCRIRIWLL
jgi:hypothetical protein